MNKIIHADEFHIDRALVVTLLKDQFPDWSKDALEPIKSFGTDNAIFRLGKNKLVRLPRRLAASTATFKQLEILNLLDHSQTIRTPRLVGLGKPNDYYPCPWSVVEWLDGEVVSPASEVNFSSFAKSLSSFLKNLWAQDTLGAPKSYRGESLKSRDKEFRASLSKINDGFSKESALQLWQKCLQVSEWNSKPFWIHGDLLPSNFLERKGNIDAVIDFDLAGIGNPAVDLLPSWCLSEVESRKNFRKILGVDNATWMRGIGWALSIAVIIIPYYQKTNPALTEIAWHMLSAIHDEGYEVLERRDDG